MKSRFSLPSPIHNDIHTEAGLTSNNHHEPKTQLRGLLCFAQGTFDLCGPGTDQQPWYHCSEGLSSKGRALAHMRRALLARGFVADGSPRGDELPPLSTYHCYDLKVIGSVVQPPQLHLQCNDCLSSTACVVTCARGGGTTPKVVCHDQS